MSDKYELLRESLHELQREASARGGNNPRSQMILDLLADHEALQAECEQLRKDAARLDWLADPSNKVGAVQLPRRAVMENLHCMRAAIDAAMEVKQ